VVTSSTTVSCKYGKVKRKTFDLSSNRRIRAVIKVPQPRFGWNGKVKAKTKSYKKGGLFGWRKYRTHISAGLIGNVYNTSCDNTPESLNRKKERRRKKVVLKYDNPHFVSHVVENGGMKGTYSQNGVTRELVLTW